jgi:cysteine-rich repeat protein
VCTGGVCQAPTCLDAVKNGSETGLDCGGVVCGACPAGQPCLVAVDCQSGVCSNNLCAAPSCTDTVKNGTETAIDCGGSCGGCANGLACAANADCLSNKCGAGNLCTSCGNGVVDAGETCDDGNLVGSDGCSAACATENGWACVGTPSVCSTVCGDGIVAGLETCDDGNHSNNDACPDGAAGSCKPASCGDGFVFNTGVGTEQCDDANAINTDGCTSQCKTGVVCTAAAFPGGDRFAVDPSNGRCYVSFDDDQTTFASAETSCVAIGGHLATITSAAENAFVLAVQNTAQNPWIGAGEDANTNDAIFDWVTTEAWSFTNFAAGQPDNDNSIGGNGDCLHLVNAAGQWNDTNCNFAGFVTGRICEVEVQKCGDGILQPTETCDDGNAAADDGCSATCLVETGWKCAGAPSTCTANGLWFNEYIEGSSNNKAVEIWNNTAGPSPLSLVGCTVRVYSNGAVSSTNINLTGSVAVGDVYTLCNPSFNAAQLPLCDQTSGSLNYNGNDAVELRCGNKTLDVIGQIGNNPGTEWGSALTSTADNTLRRKCSVTIGDQNGADAFDLAAITAQWAGFATDDFTGLGSAACAP